MLLLNKFAYQGFKFKLKIGCIETPASVGLGVHIQAAEVTSPDLYEKSSTGSLN